MFLLINLPMRDRTGQFAAEFYEIKNPIIAANWFLMIKTKKLNKPLAPLCKGSCFFAEKTEGLAGDSAGKSRCVTALDISRLSLA